MKKKFVTKMSNIRKQRITNKQGATIIQKMAEKHKDQRKLTKDGKI